MDGGAPIRHFSPTDDVGADGEVLAIEPPHRLEITFPARWDPEIEPEGPVRMIWTVAPAEALTGAPLGGS